MKLLVNTMAWLGTAAVAAVGLSAIATAQGAAAGDPSGLDLPENITIFGPQDPQIRKATAIVNGTIITDTDVDQRMALVLAANEGKIDDQEKMRLKLQVLRNLIDETLQIQEAKANEITIAPAEIQQTYLRVAGNFRRKPAEFAAYLKTIGSSENSIKRQIEGELAWRRVLGRKVDPFVSVGEEEVNAVINRLNASKGAQEYRIGEIFISSGVDPAAARAKAQNIVEQLRKGGSFASYARVESEASTAAVGGDLGWVRAEQLPAELAAVAPTLQTGQISDLIEIPGGFSIIALIDQRQVLTADPRDSVLALKQLSVTFPKGMTQAQAAPQVEAFANMVKNVTGCGTVDAIATAAGAEVVANDQVRVRDLPPQLQQMMLNLQVGQASPPFGSLEDGVRALVLCGRDDAKGAEGPSFEQVQAQMEEEKVNRSARRYLRDLRRDAVVDYR